MRVLPKFHASAFSRITATQAATLAQLPDRPCVTQHLNIHGFHSAAKQFGPLAVYGSDAYELQKLIQSDPALGERLHPALPYVKAEAIWAVRQEMARTVEDVLARRTRALILNARAASAIAPAVAGLIAPELGWDQAAKEKQIAAFQSVASNYILHG